MEKQDLNKSYFSILGTTIFVTAMLIFIIDTSLKL